MRCINCGVAVQRLQRHLVSSLSAHHQTRLSRWITNVQTQLPLDTFICQPCFLLLNTEAGEHERLLGHNMVCLGCGKSVRKIRHHNISMESPLLAVLLSQNTNYVPSRNNYVCHVCWMRTNRQAVHDSSRDMHELASDNNAAAHNVQVTSPPEPPLQPPLPPVQETITRDVSDLDKFKRRLIRTVARLLLQEKRPEAEVWACLKKETNYECKVLWARMRALTLKKLDRLFESNDNVGRIPKAARMSLTDWLLFDMVLVHQNIDVIKMHKLKNDPKPLVDLVALVKKFDIEGKRNEALALAWSSATLYYNNQGHQCSPMLLQLRWYQLKRATRDQFYNFWFAYRGIVKRLSFAEPHTPSPLQVEIARRYKNLVTLTFLEWEEMIENGEVILPEMLANKMCEKSEAVRKPTVKDDRTPDLEVIEPEIETIDLGVDSDSEGDAKKSESEPKSPVEPVKIKEERLDIDIDGPHVEEPRKQHWFDEALQHTTVEHDNLDKMAEDIDSTDDLVFEENEITQAIEHTLKQQKESMLPQITCVFGNVDESNGILSRIDALGATINNPTAIDEIERTEQNITTDTESPVAITEVPENNDTIVSENNEESVDMNIINLDDEEMEEEVTPENVAPEKVALEKVGLENVALENVVLENEALENNSSEGKAEIKPEINQDAEFKFGELSNDMSFADDGIEFVDDGIAYNDDYDNTTESNKAEEKVSDDGEPKIDLKLLMLPITYTTKLEDMGLEYFQRIRDKQLIEIICKKSKPAMKTAATEESQVIEDESITDEESIVIPDDQKVKPSSHILQKPRTRTYHPIQLCKNPDFNTRLKRLTVGFLSSPRNRGLLKACKPLTIDLTKAFECKLKDGTLYLKVNDSATVSEDTEVMSRQNVSVMPSAMPAQSLIDNTKPVEIFPSASNYEPSKPSEHSNERKKVINLQDISEIRRINQTLLTAEVSPIQVQNNTPQAQVSIVSPPQKTEVVILEKRLPSDTVNFPPSVVDITKNVSFRNVKPLQLKQKLIVERYQDLLTLKHPRTGPKVPSYKPKQFRPRIPWLSKTSDLCNPGSASKQDEALLTIDTLNKMLFLFVNENENGEGSSQKKPKIKKKRKATTDKTNDTPIVCDTDGCPNKNKTPRFNIKPGDNDPRKKGKPTEKVRESEQADDEQSSRNCCCWAQRKILYMMGTIKNSPLHDCDYPICTCCCKNLLEEYTINDHLQKRAELKRRRTLQKDDFTTNNDSESQNGNISPRAENTIEIRDDSPEPKEDPRKKGKFVICCPKATVEFPKQKQATKPVEIVDKTPEVTVISDSPIKSVDAAIQTTESDAKAGTVIDLDGLNDTSPTVTTKAKSAEVSKVPTSGDDSSVLTQFSNSAVTTISKNVVLTVNTPSKPLRNKKTKTLKKAQTPITPPMKKTEKMIYLNSKQISPKTSDNPIFLEKNKILLTTVKFPPNLYKFEEAKQVLKSSLKLPDGVNLVLLTDGTVTYAVSPNVEVRATDMASIPGIIAAVQQYINTSCIAPEPVARISIKIDSEVVNLTHDDDTSAVNTNESNLTIAVVPETEGQTDNEESTKSSDITADVDQAETSEKSNDVADVSAETNNEQQTINEKISQENISETPTTTVEAQTIETGENTGTATRNNLENDQETITEKTCQENVPERTDDERQKSNVPNENNLNDDQQSINKGNSSRSIPETAKTTTEQQPLEASQKSVEEITNVSVEPDSKSQGNSKNILSDLMEMSGIFDEDVTAQPPAAPASVTQDITEPNNLKPGPPPLNQIANEPLTPLSVRGIINELSPITSLCELKYACSNNGLFFKLDFQTRLLVPIKVCMKPHTAVPKLSIPTGPPTVQVKSVIDLTKDEDAQPEVVVPKIIETPIKVTSGPGILGGKTSKTPKPVKILKILSPPLLANQRVSNDTKNEDTYLNPRSLLRKYNRKQCLKQNVLLFDNDCIQLKKNTIVSEQFINKINPAQTLIMSNMTNDDSNVTVSIGFDRSQANDSDSSDEETLAIKAKRKRTNMDSLGIENKTVTEIAAQEAELDEPDGEGPMDVDDPHEMEPQFEIFPADENDEDSEENCILGF